jgi:transcriptional accessory protein Tex/SPT6
VSGASGALSEAGAILRAQAQAVAALSERWHRAERTRAMYDLEAQRTRQMLTMARETGQLPDVATVARAQHASAALATAEQHARSAHDFLAGAQWALCVARDLVYPAAHTDPTLASILARMPGHLPAMPDEGTPSRTVQIGGQR